MSDQSSQELEKRISEAIEAQNKVIRQNARFAAVRRIAKQIIIADRHDEEEDEEEDE